MRLDRFVGRERELADLAQSVAAHRLVTVLGPGGSGKTRLVLELREELDARFPDGVYLVELAALTPQADPLDQVATALDLADDDGRPLVESVPARLADRNVLLLMDNCEHLAAACARLAVDLLARCPQLRMVATSREALAVPGEVLYPLQGLSLPVAGEQDGGVAEPGAAAAGTQSEAVRLFAERAAESDPGFALTAVNCPIVQEICVRLDGLPLAIELAARRVRMLPVEEIRDRLVDRFALLTSAPRTASDRQRSLRATVEWSYRLLEEREQAALRRLAVLPATFDLDTAAAVCAGPGLPEGEALDVVSALFAKSLISRERTAGSGAPGAAGGVAGRLRLLESIRLYALEQLRAAGAEDMAYDRLTDWACGLTAHLAQHMNWVTLVRERLHADHANVTAALDWARDRLDPRTTVLTALLASYWNWRGFQGRRIELLAAHPDTLDSDIIHRACLLRSRALLACDQGDYRLSEELAGQALELALVAEAPGQVLEAYRQRSQARQGLGEFEGAHLDLVKGMEVARARGFRGEAAGFEAELAWFALSRGDLATAVERIESALPVLRAGGPTMASNAASAQHTAAVTALLTGRLDRAQELLRELCALELSIEQSGMLAETFALLAHRRGRPERAVTLAAAARNARDRVGNLADPWWTAHLDAAVGQAQTALGPERAKAAGAEGAAVPVEEIGAYLAAECPNGHGSPTGAPTAASVLTDRERAVARLVAQGLTNREIATELHLSVRTVATHIGHIRTKAGLRSRAQIVALATD
ncbi:ATP-binding protein [Streptomyces sp. NPDC059649]|uniref:ATP-binding protein n=1 Tax=Streptomyces sp. NPDC059649 TaxID=3346895 RepID=UPI00367C780D